jgi:type VI secretion system protein ImpH
MEMAAASGRKRASVIERLFAEAYRFDFFQAVRLLERKALEAGDSARRPVGGDEPPGREIVRFRALASLTFPSGSVAQVSAPSGDDGQPDMQISFMGLTGPSGVLPQHYSSMVIERTRRKDLGLRDFLDLFNHRVISLFYRAGGKYRFPISYERARLDRSSQTRCDFTEALYCLIGMGTPGLRGRMSVNDEVLLFYAGHMAHHPRCAVSLEQILSTYFGLPARVMQFIGQWLPLSRENRSRLPARGQTIGANCRIGSELVLGDRVWDISGKFRVRLGPLRFAQYRRFIPAGDGLRSLSDLVRLYVGQEFDFDVQPVLMAAEIPQCRLGDSSRRPRLGRDFWMRSTAATEDFKGGIFTWDDSAMLTSVAA